MTVASTLGGTAVGVFVGLVLGFSKKFSDSVIADGSVGVADGFVLSSQMIL